MKIGKPDHEAFRRVVRGEPEEKTWTYFPHARDRQTMTVLTFHSGVVTEIDRRIARQIWHGGWLDVDPRRGGTEPPRD